MTDSKLKPFPKAKRSSRKNLTKTNNSSPQNPPKQETSKANAKPSELLRVRLLLVWGVLLAGIFGLGWKLYQLQIVQAPELQKKARRQQMVNLRPYIPRRSIIDSQGNVLAADRLVYTLYVHPKLFKISKEEIATKLATILEEQTSQELLKQFNKRESGIRLASALPEAVADKITKLSLDGLELIQHYSRFYPQQEMVSDVIGYVDLDHRGQAGVEFGQRKLLERTLLTFQIRRAGNGMIMPANLPKGLLKFDDLRLQLTLDLRLQRAARSALKKKMKQFNAKRGSVIIMDVRDGSLLALACEPTYNPNRYFKYDIELFKNWAVTDLYEPGSTFKPVNVAIALEAGVIRPHSYLHDSGKIKVDGWNISNHDYYSRGGRGYISIAKILQHSSNVGMIKIMSRMSKKDYYNTLKKLGLGEKVGVDMPFEIPGHLKSETVFTARSIEVATTAFGQGFSFTPLKLVQLHGAIANGGKLVTPHVVQGLADSQGQFHWQPSFPTKSVFSAKTSRTVLEMMETVVTKGSGKSAQIEDYRIAGKTGTAQKASPRGGYYSNAKITSFVAILPVDSPRYVVLAVVDEPKGGNTFGSTVAAPIVKEVMEALISVKEIPPSK
ncbi:MAG: peptidoglycan D,D-transpeptidase FtsI family protein [Xenococcaceae cyanobacterium]